jgi:hypothetical protein
VSAAFEFKVGYRYKNLPLSLFQSLTAEIPEAARIASGFQQVPPCCRKDPFSAPLHIRVVGKLQGILEKTVRNMLDETDKIAATHVDGIDAGLI